MFAIVHNHLCLKYFISLPVERTEGHRDVFIYANPAVIMIKYTQLFCIVLDLSCQQWKDCDGRRFYLFDQIKMGYKIKEPILLKRKSNRIENDFPKFSTFHANFDRKARDDLQEVFRCSSRIS